MKKFFILLLTAVVGVSTLSAGYFDDKGLFSGWKFSPLQIDVSLVKSRKLFDESTDTVFSLGLFILEQKSAIVSAAFIANTLQNNYGIQVNPFMIGVATDNNYGISVGIENYCKNCYGIQLGILNHFWSENIIEKEKEFVQICGANIAGTLFVGVVNSSDKFQIGLLNFSPNAIFQIGLLNFNANSYIPWMPLINFDMGRKINKTKNPAADNTPAVQQEM